MYNISYIIIFTTGDRKPLHRQRHLLMKWGCPNVQQKGLYVDKMKNE